MDASTSRSPTGASRPGEAVLRSSKLELTFLPGFGCHWTRLRAEIQGEWRDVLDPVPPEAALAAGGLHGSFIMAPWSNRIAGASFAFEGKTHSLRSSSKDGTAIHGDVRSRPWRVVDRSETRFEAALRTEDFPDFNYPFPLVLRHTLEIRGERLRVDISIENSGRSRAPVGFGFHPYFRRRLTERDEDCIVILPADLVYPAERCIPTGPPQPVTGELDLRRKERLGARGLDHCYTGITAPDIRVVYPGSDVELRFRVDPIFGHAVVYTPNKPDGEPEAFIAVEPVTNANDGFNLRERGYERSGVKVLDPGETWGGGWELAVVGG